MRNIIIVIFMMICSAFFISCKDEPVKTPAPEEKTHGEYKIKFSEQECRQKFEEWKNRKPDSYYFESIGELGADLGELDMAEVTVTPDGSTVVPFDNGYDIVTRENYRNYNFTDHPKVEPGHKYYIESMDSLYEIVLGWYEKYKEDISNENLYKVSLRVDYDEEYSFIKKVYFCVYYKMHGEYPGQMLEGDDGDDVYYLTIDNFKVLNNISAQQ